MLTRREFHAALLSLAAAAALPRAVMAGPAPSPRNLWLNRLTFGTSPVGRATLQSMGPEAWLDAQLAPSPPDDELDARLASTRLRIAYPAGDDGNGRSWPALDELRPLEALSAAPETLLPLLDYGQPMDYALRSRPADEVIAASLIRAVHAKAQLREVMTQFWHEHFNVTATKDESTAVFFPAYDQMLRSHALGNFRAMLGDVAASPAMLNYLGNGDSRASPANENFARELLELHTLGADNYLSDRYAHWSDIPVSPDGVAVGYIDEDVYEVARAFTGWSVGDGRTVSEGVNTPQTGRFTYVEAWHDPYQKRVLAQELDDHSAPLADGNAVLDLLAVHPATAGFVTRKIARRLLQDDPSEALVADLAKVFLAAAQAPDQIAQVIKAVVMSDAFTAPPSKLRRPFEFIAALLRASGAEVVAPDAAWRWELARAGWRQHTYGAPTGHPDTSVAWANTTVLARLVDFALNLHQRWGGVTTSDLGAMLPAGVTTYGAAMDHWAAALGADPAPARTAFLSGAGVEATTPLPDDPAERRTHMALAFAFAALGPETLFR